MAIAAELSSYYYSHHFEIFDLYLYSDLETRARSHSRSSKMIPFNRPPMTSYRRSMVTIALSDVVSAIFDVEKYRHLEIQGQSWSLKMVRFDRLVVVSY